MWTQASTSEAYGNVIYNNGWQGTGHQHGHNFYCQHAYTGSGLATIARNISLSPYDNAIQMYGSYTAEVSRFRCAQNIFVGKPNYGGRIVLGTRTGGAANRVRDDQVTENFGWGADANLAYHADDDAYLDVIITGNYFVNTLWEISSWQTAVITNNTLFLTSGNNKMLAVRTNEAFLPWTMDRNTFYPRGIANPYNLDTVVGGFYTLAQWRAKSGYELNSTESASDPAANYVVVQSNAYDTNRAQVAIYNWTGATFIALDVAALGWDAGAGVRVRNCQDYFGDAVDATITSTNTLVVNMQASAHTVVAPYGDTAPLVAKTFPAFAALVLERTEAAPPPPITYTLNVDTTDAGGSVPVLVSPADNAGLSNGNTPFTRNYNENVVSALTASSPAPNGNLFSKWQLGGIDYSSTAAATITNTANQTLTIVYVAPGASASRASGNRRRSPQ